MSYRQKSGKILNWRFELVLWLAIIFLTIQWEHHFENLSQTSMAFSIVSDLDYFDEAMKVRQILMLWPINVFIPQAYGGQLGQMLKFNPDELTARLVLIYDLQTMSNRLWSIYPDSLKKWTKKMKLLYYRSMIDEILPIDMRKMKDINELHTQMCNIVQAMMFNKIRN